MGNFTIIWWVIFILSVVYRRVNGFGYSNYTDDLVEDDFKGPVGPDPLFVGLTLIQGAADKGAVCLDGTLPGYHLHHGHGSGANSWLIQLEGGGWCNNVRTCVYRKGSRRGSSKYMEKQLQFTGILSDKASENPDFFNWNRVKLRYCDGASFAGEGEDKAAGLQFRGQRIWLAGMEELMSKGMKNANQALLSGCSAGGLASILHCDEFRGLFPSSTKVKCLGDAGLFLDAINIYGTRTMRNIFNGVVTLQGVGKNLPSSCTNRHDPTSCFFPENLIANIKTPLFLLNSAYDSWQVKNSLIPTNDPNGCRNSLLKCSTSQIKFFQEFRNHMLTAINSFSTSKQNGWFINSCFSHCHTENQATWFTNNSPRIGNKRVADAIGDWFFNRGGNRSTDCHYPCDKTCINQM